MIDFRRCGDAVHRASRTQGLGDEADPQLRQHPADRLEVDIQGTRSGFGVHQLLPLGGE